jgi:glycosyltransferase involved in cell wall biosynthesis
VIKTSRVLQVVLSLNPGGTERLVMDLATRLPDVATAVCCLDQPGLWGDQLRNRGVAVTALGREPGFHPLLGRRIAAAAKAHRATVIHAHQYTPFVYAAIGHAWSPAIPIVFTEHGRLSDAPPSAKRGIANRLLRQAAAAVFAVSRDLSQFMMAEGFAADGVQVIYNGVEAGPVPTAADRAMVRTELAVTPDELVVGTVARFDPVKDLQTLLHAVAALSKIRSVTAVLVGDGPERPGLETLVDTLGIRERVRFLGHREDARRWLAGFDGYVNCSISEGVSLTILEAMAAALPVIATNVGGTPEVVTTECGVLIPPRDPQALARAMGALNAGTVRSLGLAGRQRVEACFTIERMVNDYGSVYRSLTGKVN